MRKVFSRPSLLAKYGWSEEFILSPSLSYFNMTYRQFQSPYLVFFRNLLHEKTQFLVSHVHLWDRINFIWRETYLNPNKKCKFEINVEI